MAPAPTDPLATLTRLAAQMSTRHSLEALLQLVAEAAAEALGVRRVSLRLLDPSHTQLLATARSGEPLHREAMEFQIGEGLLGWIAAHGEPLCLAEPEADPRFAPRPGMGPMGAFLGVPIRSGAQVIGVLSAIDPAVRFDDHHRQLLELVAAMCAPHIELARLADLIQLDPLTGSLNRRGLDQRYPADHVADADAAPLVVAMLDLDHFKLVNDRHGHAVGDLVLRHVTAMIGQALRADDALVRFGGEEFLLLLPGLDRERGVRIAERVRAAVAGSPATIPGGQVVTTVSIGVAERRPGESRDAVFARADAALYQAKAAGRDRVVAA
jgi:diguanylate cyclase (GGDEF)-like protein